MAHTVINIGPQWLHLGQDVPISLATFMPIVLNILKKKGKDVDLYSAFHAPGTPNAHVTETGPPDRYFRSPPSLRTQPRQ